MIEDLHSWTDYGAIEASGMSQHSMILDSSNLSSVRNPGWLFDIGDEIPPNCMGIIMNQYRDPYKPISISWNVIRVLNTAHLYLVALQCFPNPKQKSVKRKLLAVQNPPWSHGPSSLKTHIKDRWIKILPETNSSPLKNWWLEDDPFRFGNREDPFPGAGG